MRSITQINNNVLVIHILLYIILHVISQYTNIVKMNSGNLRKINFKYKISSNIIFNILNNNIFIYTITLSNHLFYQKTANNKV